MITGMGAWRCHAGRNRAAIRRLPGSGAPPIAGGGSVGDCPYYVLVRWDLRRRPPLVRRGGGWQGGAWRAGRRTVCRKNAGMEGAPARRAAGRPTRSTDRPRRFCGGAGRERGAGLSPARLRLRCFSAPPQRHWHGRTISPTGTSGYSACKSRASASGTPLASKAWWNAFVALRRARRRENQALTAIPQNRGTRHSTEARTFATALIPHPPSRGRAP